METTLYGIPTCSTVQKAKDWLDSHHIPFTFFDFKKEVLVPEKISHWINQLGAHKVLNRQSLSWRKLSAEDQRSADNLQGLIALLIQKPTLIKRPLLERGYTKLLCGFSPKAYEEFLSE